MLVVEGLTCRFGTKAAVDNASFSVAPGSFVGVIGRSGAGKSTLLRTINRLAEPTSGAHLFDGLDVTALKGRDLRRWRARSAMIFQQFNLIGRLDVLTNVLMGRLADMPHGGRCYSSGRSRTGGRDVGARTVRHGIARCTARRSTFRRPAAARRDRARAGAGAGHHPRRRADRLARSAQHQIVMDALLRINKHFGITVMCNLHSLDLARSYCDRLIGMAAGRVVFDGAPAALTDHIARELYDLEADEVMERAAQVARAFPRADSGLRTGCRLRRQPRLYVSLSD